ncbi:ferredoxin reductase [Microlunatus capsulatus]|uniref:Ferredoxin-NADP reductase n=1 Tax=Microlunatus capsulatus TaxID=99117 RepID=A0ABS4Z7Q4_9ACTN|nr:ferredoxin reductase [Microlunatus capsulatus]MBP2417086.1 ferredoxin-NADP reductase [Microlunatus capsulatus]
MSSFLLAPSARPLRGVVRALRELAGSAVTPLVPADYLDLVSPLRRGADLRGRVVALEPETADAVTVRIRPGRSWRPHRAGQYIRLGVDVDGVRQWRAYSLTSLRRAADGLLSVTVKAIPGGKVSNHVVRALRPGTLVHLDQAAGGFVLPEVLPAATLFVTAGSGITPVMGMLRNHLDELADVVVLHSAPTAQDVVFGPELRAWAAQGRLRLVERHTAAEGVLTPAELDAVVPDWRERHTWACGPTGLLDAFEEHFDGAGLGHRLHTERFRPVVIAAGEGGTLSFARQGSVVEADGATPILDAGEDAGVLMPSGCRMGICFGCVVPLTSGAVRDLRNGELVTAGEGDDVRIQTCVSAAAGPCTIDL